MKTNREWLESLTDRQLAEFLTSGLYVCSMYYIGEPFMISINRISMNYSTSMAGIEKWLLMPQNYEVEKGGAE